MQQPANKSLLTELRARESDPLLHRSVLAIEEMRYELDRSSKQIQEQKKLIEILKEGKEYYEQEYRNSSWEAEFMQVHQEKHHLGLLVARHRRANH